MTKEQFTVGMKTKKFVPWMVGLQDIEITGIASPEEGQYFIKNGEVLQRRGKSSLSKAEQAKEYMIVNVITPPDIVYVDNGVANEWMLRRGTDWYAKIQFNGTLMEEEQIDVLNHIAQPGDKVKILKSDRERPYKKDLTFTIDGGKTHQDGKTKWPHLLRLMVKKDELVNMAMTFLNASKWPGDSQEFTFSGEMVENREEKDES